MADINTVSLSGRLTKDAEGHGDPGPRYALRFSIANNERRKDPATGEWGDIPSFFDCVMFGNYASSVADSMRKGTKVSLSGRLRQRPYTTKDGQRRSAIEVIPSELVVFDAAPASRQIAGTGDAYAQEDLPF